MKLGTDIIQTTKAHADLDAFYGPYEATSNKSALDVACEKIPLRYRAQGLTIGIIDQFGKVVEYQWKTNNLTGYPEEKVESFNLTITPVGEQELVKEEGESIQFQYKIEGRATISKGFIYQIVGTTEIFLGEFTNIGKGTNTYVLNNPSTSGIYTYRIKILDSSGAYATTRDNDEYIEYVIRYGGISISYNLANLNTIQIKNKYSVAERYFICGIKTRDNSFNVQGLYLSDSQEITETSILLTPYSNPNTQADSYLGNNYYYLPNTSELDKYNGKTLYSIIKYTEETNSGINQQYKVKSLFTLLDITSLELVPESTFSNYYLSIPAYYTFQLQSGVENVSVVFSEGEDSDFTFDTVTIQAYRRYSLKVIPKTVKNNARLKANFSFRYNNVETTGTFDEELGNIIEVPVQNYFQPDENTISLEKIIDPTSEDYNIIEDGKYTKIINTPVSSEVHSSSFILDLYCKINQSNNRNIKYLTINYGNVEVGYITEDDIYCQGIKTDTPLNEWIQIGLGVNLEETIVRNAENKIAKYHAIYINGMVVKNIPISEKAGVLLQYDPSKLLTITLSNSILIQKCFLYHKINGVDGIYPNTDQSISIIYNNYKSHKTNFSEPDNLPVLKLRKITDQVLNEQYFNLINAYKESHGEDPIKHTTTFGSIGADKQNTMGEYDNTYTEENSPIESDATLFRQSVNIKKPAQKEYAVLCYGQWFDEQGDDILSGSIIEVHTQGTSTLQYSVPNFKFTFWKMNQNDQIEHFNPKFVEKLNYTSEEDRYYNEYTYTAKCDYMDSSHLNNTPTCIYYNNIIQNLISTSNIEGSPSARNGNLDAIVGFPIVLEISDQASNFSDYFTNIGSFMLNVDKTGNSLGFEIDENGQHLSCLSLEGTSNDNNTGASGRFIIPNEILLKYNNGASEIAINSLKSYLDSNGNLLEQEIQNDFNEAKSSIGNLPINEALIQLPYVQWCNFLSQGLEYRYPDSDMYKEKNSHVNKILSLDHFKKIYKMWAWVNNSDSLDESVYKEQFVQHFDLKYCMLYFIQLMVFGQTDNLGKNAMFDTWGDTGIWYPRPYDLDSQTGLDNAGNDNIAPFVEIKPEFSLNYSPLYTQEQLVELNLTDKSTIRYGTEDYDRYHYSSNNSKLWINFYKNYKSEINTFYSLLKAQLNYNAESIINLCEELLINKLGINQYNQDFVNKYLANISDQYLAYGNRWIKFKNWIRRRFAFCDSYFSAQDSATYSLVSNISYYLKLNSPQYVIQQYQSGGQNVQFVLDQINFSTGSGGATFVTLMVNQNSVLDINLFKYVTLLNGNAAFEQLLSLDVSGNTRLNSITSVVGNNLPNLKTLTINDSGVRTLTVPSQLKTLNAKNVTLDSLTFNNNCLVEDIDLSGSTINGQVYFSNLIKLKTLNLQNCTFKQNVTFSNVEELTSINFTGAKFEGIIEFQDGINITEFDFSGIPLAGINFSGSNLNFKKLNFQGTIFSNSTLNINAISSNIENLNFNSCQGLQHLELTDNNSFQHLQVFNIQNSPIQSLGSDNTIFNASPSIFTTGIGNLYKTYTKNTNGTVTSTPFNFRDTKVQRITNISWEGTGKELFYNCLNLISVTGTLNLRYSIDYLFTACKNLEILPTINIDTTKTSDGDQTDYAVTSAIYAFSGANKIGYNNIYNIIRKCTKVTNFTSACKCTQLTSNQEVNLTTLFQGNNVVKTLTEMFRPIRYSNNDPTNITSVTNTIRITGQIPQSVTTTDRMLSAFSNGITINYEIIRNAYNLNSALGMFYGSQITFVGSNLPTYTDTLGQSIILNNTVNKEFFPQNHIEDSQTIAPALTNILGIFYNTNVQIIDTNVFSQLTNLTNCGACFGGTLRKFSVKNSENDTEDINLDINNIWINNSKLTNVAGCFEGIYNVYCTGLTFHSNVHNINICGLFGLSNGTNKSYKRIFINIDSIVPNIVSNNDARYSIPGTSTIRGAFENREVMLISSGNTSILSKLSSNCRQLFKGSTLFVDSSVTTFNLSNVITSCYEMFRSCTLYKYNNDPEYVYSDADRYFVDIILPSACSEYYAMFYGSSILKNLPSLNSSSSGNLSYMYHSCIINNSNVILPANYFDICRNNVSNTSYMFSENKYLRELEYSSSKGLLQDCVNLSNVTYMFNGTTSLHKGIPNNLFGTSETSQLTKLKSLEGMFKTSDVLYDIENGSNKWMTEETLSPIVELTSIKEMFCNNRSNSATSAPGYSYTIKNVVKDSLNNDVYIISPTTFINHFIDNISGLFKNSSVNIPFQFLGFINGDEAFLDDSITSIDQMFITNLANITRIGSVQKMFYDIVQGGSTGRNISNLELFINSIDQLSHIRKDYVAGNLTNSDIPEKYKQDNSSYDSQYYYGFAAGTAIIYG